MISVEARTTIRYLHAQGVGIRAIATGAKPAACNRSDVYKRQLLNRVAADLGDAGKIESMPRLEGRQMVMMITPK